MITESGVLRNRRERDRDREREGGRRKKRKEERRAQVVPINGPFSRTIKGEEPGDKWMMGWATTLHLVKKTR